MEHEFPDIHDYYGVTAEHSDQELSLCLNWVEYSRERRVDMVTKVCYLRFKGVTDIDASPSTDPPSQSNTWAGNLSASFQRRAQSARALIAQIRLHSLPSRGEPLNYVETVPGGFLLVTHIGGDYFVRANSVDCGCSRI